MFKKRILIVDDEPKFTQMVRFNLEKTGAYEVMEVNHPKQALEAATRFKPDLVLLDVMMPGMDGGDVAAQLRRNPGLKNVPVMFVTAAVAQSEAGEHGYRSGGDIFLAKPITLDALLAAIAENLRHSPPVTDACKGP
ncbi:MAG: response regulator [Lentisphaerae bacterium]|nr:response regulator [Lentisphaerota bacterium]